MIRNIYRGMSYLFRGAVFIVTSGLKKYFLVPLVINLTVFSVLTWFGISYFGDLLNWLLPAGDAWWAVSSRVFLWLVFAVTSLLLIFFTFSVAANLIGSPFNAVLAEKIEEVISGGTLNHAPVGSPAFVHVISSSIVNELRKIIYYSICTALILIFALVPVANIFFPFLWILFTSWMLALEYLSYPMENHGMKFRDVRTESGKQLFMNLGFGLAVMIATMLPLFNLVIMPAAVAGATIMWNDQRKER